MKSYFGSRGVAADHLMGQAAKADLNKRYALINDGELRTAVVAAAAKRFGYPLDHVRLRLYVGSMHGAQRLRLAGALHLLSSRLDEDLADPDQRADARAPNPPRARQYADGT